MEENKNQLEDMKIKYVSSRDEKEYALTIDKIKNKSEDYLTCSDSNGGYTGIDLKNGEITREYLEEGIPQPYTAGIATAESLNLLKEALAAEKEGKNLESKMVEPKTEETNTEQMEAMKQLMELLEQQNMQEQTQGFQEVFQYMAGMQLQLGLMAEELHNVKEQLAQATDSQSAPMKEKLVKQAEHLEGKIAGLMEKLIDIKDSLVETAAKALQAFKEKGQQGLNKVLDTGVVGVKNMISAYRNQLSDTLMNFEKTANQIDSIGDELKQIGNSTANVGRLIAGKGTKEVSEEKPGVALTRIINAPVKRQISSLKSCIEKTGKMCEKLEQISEKLQPEKPQPEKETQGQDKESKKTEDKQNDRVSVKERLEQMKVKTATKKQPEKVQMKAKEQAASI